MLLKIEEWFIPYCIQKIQHFKRKINHKTLTKALPALHTGGGTKASARLVAHLKLKLTLTGFGLTVTLRTCWLHNCPVYPVLAEVGKCLDERWEGGEAIPLAPYSDAHDW